MGSQLAPPKRPSCLLLLFRHRVKSSIDQEECLATSSIIGDEVPHAPRDSSEGARALKQRCYPHTGNGGHHRRLSSSLSLPIGFSFQDEAIDVDRSAPHIIVLT